MAAGGSSPARTPRDGLPNPRPTEHDQAEFVPRILGQLLQALDAENIVYAILGDASRLPEIATDLDLLIGSSAPAIELVQQVCQANALTLVKLHWHATGIRCDMAGVDSDGRLRHFPGPDLITRLPDGRRRIGARAVHDMLADRVRDARGYWLLSPRDSFLYAVLKAVRYERPFAPLAGYLDRLWGLAGKEIAGLIAETWTAGAATMIEAAARSGDWRAVQLASRQLARDAGLRRRSVAKLGPRRAYWRITRPSGLWIALLGPDGAGKTTLLATLASTVAPLFRGAHRFHLIPLRPIEAGASPSAPVAPHTRAPRGRLGSTIKILWLIGAVWPGYLKHVWPALLRDRLVLFDRYVDDLAVDPRRYRHGGPMWLARLLPSLLPRPDLILLLDLPGEVAHGRKPELTPDEAERQREAFRRLVGRLGPHVVLDAARSPDAVAGQAVSAILDHLGKRAESRNAALPRA